MKFVGLSSALIVHEIAHMQPGGSNPVANYAYYRACFGDLETVDKLTHSLASVKKIMAFMEDEDGYSGDWMGGPYRNSYRNSYARGGRRRDSMGRYSGEYGYSRNDLADKMRDLMRSAPDDRTRQEMQRMVEKLENA